MATELISNDMHSEESYDCSTVVYVTDQFRCEHFIQIGRQIADTYQTNLYVVNVSGQNPIFGSSDLDALEYLYQVSRNHHAVMNVFYDSDIAAVLYKTAVEFHAIHIVIGMPKGASSVLHDLFEIPYPITFHLVDKNGQVKIANSAFPCPKRGAD